MKERIFPRDLIPKLEKWLDRRECYAIRGPRQSGKTTLLKILKERLERENNPVIFLNFEDMDVLESFEKNPKEFIKSFMKDEKRHYFLLDEYHYVRKAGKTLKLLYDTIENAKFIITGSSTLEISGAMGKYLVGRVFFFELFPFSFHEFLVARDERLARIYEKKHELVLRFIKEGRSFKVEDDIFLKEFKPYFDEYVIYGGYPEVIKARDKETKVEILKNIYNTYISKDVVEFLRFSDALKYRNVVKLLALNTGNMLNYQEICSETNIYYQELRKIISALSETFIVHLIRPFHKNPRTEIRKTPKIYFFDNGLRNYITGNFNPLEARPDRGAIAENSVFLSLKQSFPDGIINYWRTTAKAEVDFVLRFGNELFPVEVKYQSMEKPKITRSFRSFIATYKPKRALVVTKDFWGEITIGRTIVKFVPIIYL